MKRKYEKLLVRVFVSFLAGTIKTFKKDKEEIKKQLQYLPWVDSFVLKKEDFPSTG